MTPRRKTVVDAARIPAQRRPEVVAGDNPAAYVAFDRRRAIAAGSPLPNRTSGAVLFADISGFTPLTEALATELGGRRGAEELTAVLDRVFGAVLEVVHRFGGDVIYFSGDAVTCWLDRDNGRRAVACALQMQEAMTAVSTVVTPGGVSVELAMKVAVAAGEARRFVVGDPDVQLIDVLAGRLVDRVAEVEHHAQPNEVVVDAGLLQAAADAVVVERRGDVAVVAALRQPAEPPPVPTAPPPVPDEVVRQWLLPRVYERLSGGRGELLADLRPAVPLFLKFGGIDFDEDDDAEAQLDDFVKRAQRIIADLDGSTLQLTLGDKGAYLYAVFGSPVAHEDDAARACAAAVELLALDGMTAARDLQLGIASGRLRSGTYGHPDRRTFCCLGDAVNLAARLMARAPVGGAYVAADIARAVPSGFAWEPLDPIRVKGKSEPIVAAQLLGRRTGDRHRTVGASTGFIGRVAELEALVAAGGAAASRSGQLVKVVGEAGLGKSRLVAEAAARWSELGLRLVSGDATAIRANTAYSAWRAVWWSLLGVDPSATVAEIQGAAADAVSRLDSRAAARLPLLGVLLGVQFEDTPLTAALDASQRKTALESLATQLITLLTADEPTVILLEDGHWLDPLSRDLLSAVARSLPTLPLLVVVTTRPDPVIDAMRLDLVAHASQVRLEELDDDAAMALVRDALVSAFGQLAATPDAIRVVTGRGQGNPFYLQEIVNFLRDNGVDATDAAAVARAEIPDTLHTLVLSRIDVLAEEPRRAAKVASVVGRYFRAAAVAGAYPDLGSLDDVVGHLHALHAADIALPEVAGEVDAWAFRHVVTRDVAYESLPMSVRLVLHGRVGDYIESSEPDIDRHLDLLAHHYWLSDDLDKKRHYLLRAGVAAQDAYSNDAAVDYFRRAAGVLDGEQRLEVLLRLSKVQELRGDLHEAEAVANQVLDQTPPGDRLHAAALVGRGEARRRLGHFDDAVADLEAAREGFTRLADEPGTARALHLLGTIAVQRGEYDTAEGHYRQSLAIRDRIGDLPATGAMLNNLGIIAEYAGDYERAEVLHLQAREIREQVGDPWALANSHQNLGMVELLRGDTEAALADFERGLQLTVEVGDVLAEGLAHHNVANACRDLGRMQDAAVQYRKALELDQLIDDPWALANLFEDVALMAVSTEEYEHAFQLTGAADALRDKIGSPRSPEQDRRHTTALEPAARHVSGRADAIRSTGRSLSVEEATTLVVVVCDLSASTGDVMPSSMT